MYNSPEAQFIVPDWEDKVDHGGMKKKDLIQVRNEYSPQLSKLLYNWQFKNKEAL
jgi:hypothetical protein